jgi:ABC-type uncharacterized transport system permease subunit
MISMTVITSALELGFIYALVAMALFLSFRILNIADMTTDGSFTLGCAVSATVALAGHPYLALPAAMLAGSCAGIITALLQTKWGVPSILAGIITNTGLYTVNLAVMGFSSNVNLLKATTIFSTFPGMKIIPAVIITVIVAALLVLLAVLLSVYRRFRKGTAALYLAGYGIIRFGLETLRGDPRVAFFGLSIGQLISIGVVALGIVFAAACGIFSSGRKDSAAGPSPKSE